MFTYFSLESQDIGWIFTQVVPQLHVPWNVALCDKAHRFIFIAVSGFHLQIIAELQLSKGKMNAPPPSSSKEGSKEDREKQEADRKKKADIAQKRRSHLMDQMKAMQKSFIRQNPEFFEETSISAREERLASSSIDSV